VPIDTILVLTARSPNRIVRERGSQAWVLNKARARQCEYLVCCQNQHNRNHNFSDATEPHGTAFLVGKISAIRDAAEDEGGPHRKLIEISEFARISKAKVWKHWRNPVGYTSLEELGIDLAKLNFEPLPGTDVKAAASVMSPKAGPATSMLTIAEAKRLLAATFGVKPNEVEITIRG
jgi:hypothetical protein